MESRDTQSSEKAAELAAIRENVRAQEAARTQDKVYEEVRIEAWSQMRAKLRVTIAVAMAGTLLVGVLIGFYGFRAIGNGAGSELTPPASWGSEALTGRTSDTGTPGGAAITPWPIRVYVSGAVSRAQVVELSPGSLVIDAVEAAGGATSHADLDALNLAASLADNQHILVPTLRAASPVQESGYESDPRTMSPININTASITSLQSLPYIGITRAEDIVAYREANGPFQQIEDILSVPGIGPTIYEGIAPLITVGP